MTITSIKLAPFSRAGSPVSDNWNISVVRINPVGAINTNNDNSLIQEMKGNRYPLKNEDF